MAAQNPAAYARVIVKKDGFPWSLTNAFQKPVTATQEKSVEERSVEVLEEYFGRLCKIYGSDSVICDTSLNLYNPQSLSLQTMLQNVSTVLG